MVASTHWLASAVGVAVLERGGNAFDAAAAAGFTLQVVEPHLNGPGGEVPMLVSAAGSDDVVVVAGQGPAPRGATIEHYRAEGLDLVPGTGHLAACVPAAFDAWVTLLDRFGTWPLADVLDPAIGYAERGFPVLPAISRTIATVERLFTDHWPTSAATWLPGGAVPAPGTRLRNPALAGTYRRLAAIASAAPDRSAGLQAARDAFHRGFVAEAVDAFVRTPVLDTSGTPHAGVLTADDLAAWTTPLEAPATFDFGSCRVCKTPPWGQGPVLLQQLALLDGLDWRDTAPHDPQFVHTVVEASKLAFADREAFYGDVPDVPLADLLDPGYNADRRRLVTDTASGELRPGAPAGRVPRLPRPVAGAAAAGVGEPTLASADTGVEPAVDARGATRGDTCHLDVVDRFGNMVSATPSGGWLQSAPVIPGLGFALGTRAQMFWLEPGLPNSLAPGKRPRTTLSPSLALRDGVPWLAFGTPGGDQQDQWQLPFFLFHTVFGMNLQQAIEAPTWHSTHFPSSFYPRDAEPRGLVVEARVGASTVADLRRRGHLVTEVDGWSLGRLSAVSRGADGFLRAAANPRGAQGYAAGR
ncbi:MAG: gamma-glutamyltransferase family protein [Jatrophihabitans sp.]|uniref:gamma-glutamyltransferase family protein n=1 Tax=Jatrophihabitans sp. TaxID=1932789 RepID=UPI003F7F59C9